MGTFEITQGQWSAMMGENPSTFQRHEEAGRLPFERVSWDDAQAFIARLIALTEGHFRLPTEAEWEYVYRAGTKQANPWGLYDLHGSVWEWCSDWFGAYDGAASTNPTGSEAGTHKLIRGGSWFNEPEALRCANRHRHPQDSRQTNLGLRVVWSEPSD